MKLSPLALTFTAAALGQELEQYTPDATDWSLFYEKAAIGNDDHSPDGAYWIPREDWVPWNGEIYNPEEYTKHEFGQLLCPKTDTVRGMYELYKEHEPFADAANPTKAEVDYWHGVVVNHVRAMVGYTEEEYIIRPDKCQHLRALWSREKRTTRKWDNEKYPDTCEGNPNQHCGFAFLPDEEDQQPYLPDDIDECRNSADSEGIFSAAKSNTPWSIKWVRPFCHNLKSEGFWGGHTGPWFVRSKFGWDWYDANPENYNSNAVLRARWGGPKGPHKYTKPSTGPERWRIQDRDVNPDPRFQFHECERIIPKGQVENATQCSDQIMADDECGKLFMTIEKKKCGCYPQDMSRCEVKVGGDKKTWDLEPIQSVWDGLFIDESKDFSNNELPFDGKECPNIRWSGKAGDPTHCLQRIVESNYFDGICGRKFLTWNAGNGGCACYGPEQVTCNNPLSRPSRQTFELEVDPTYEEPPPTAPTDSPIPLPTDPPVVADDPFEPTDPPVSSPPSSCVDDASGYFLMSKKRHTTGPGNEKTTYGVVRTCAWLAQQANKNNLCRSKVDFHQGKAYEAGTHWSQSSLEGLFRPAQKLCQETCNSCDTCYENPKSKFFKGRKGGKPNGNPQYKNCEYLSKTAQNTMTRLCEKTDTFGGYQSASVECPLTCKFVTNDCDQNEVSQAPTPAPPPGTQYVGCYINLWWDKTLPEDQGNDKSISECANLCSDYKYFGLWQDYRCFCGNGDYDKHGSDPNPNRCDCYHPTNVGQDQCVFENIQYGSASFWG